MGAILSDFAQEGGPAIYHDEQRVTLAGVITASRTKTTRNNSLMAYVTLEDDTASMEMLVFARVLGEAGPYLKEGVAVLAEGRISVRDEKAPQLMCGRPHHVRLSVHCGSVSGKQPDAYTPVPRFLGPVAAVVVPKTFEMIRHGGGEHLIEFCLVHILVLLRQFCIYLIGDLPVAAVKPVPWARLCRKPAVDGHVLLIHLPDQRLVALPEQPFDPVSPGCCWIPST